MHPERLTNFGQIAWAESGANHMARYLFAAGCVSGKRVLDVGTGMGYGAALLKAAGAESVVGIDVDSLAVAAATRQFGRDGVQFAVGNCHAVDAPGEKYDVVCSFENIEYIAHPEKFVASARNCLNAGGILLCSSTAREQSPEFVNGKPANPLHVTEWLQKDFEAVFRASFSTVTMFTQAESFGLTQRREAVEPLVALLRHPIRSGTVLNVTRVGLYLADRVGWKSLRANSGLAKNITGIACPSPADFPVVRAEVAMLYGVPFCSLVECRL